MSSSEDESPFHCGSVALIGAPNAGKSTLLNQALGQKISIVSPKPQTTRNRVIGVVHQPDAQIVLVDTPGIHSGAKSPLNRAMVRLAESALGEVDAVCWVLDAERSGRRAAADQPLLSGVIADIADLLARAEVPVVVALNKVDRLPKPALLPVLAALAERLPGAELVPISARTGDGVGALLRVLASKLPEGAAIYPPDLLTESPERFVVAELIREQLIRATEQEIPYSTAVEIERFDEGSRDGDRPFVEIFARILVERTSQKGIVIGKGGAMLKKVGTAAREEIEALLGAKVYLELHVSVREDWSSDPAMLRKLGIA